MPSNYSTLRSMYWSLFGLTLLFVVVWQAPAFHVVAGLANYLPLHMFAETSSIIVSMMVFGIVWNVRSAERSSNIVILSCALLAVGLIDFAHMLSFKGMPDFITPSGPEKAINLWLSARLLAALALLVVALRPWQLSHNPRERYGFLAGSLAIAAAVIWLGLVYPQAWPRTFIAGQGLAPFKIGAEYAIIAILLIPTVLFYFQAKQPQSYDAASLFAATAISILSELSFTLYSDVADIFNLLGHLYKIVAYFFIYRAVFIVSVNEPFQRLDAELSENRRITKVLQTASLYTRSLIEASLDPLVTISTEGKITDVNRATEAVTGRSRSELIGTDFSDYFTAPDKAREGYQQVFSRGFVSDYPLALRHRDGHVTEVLYNASVFRSEAGDVLGVFAAARDITEQKRAQGARSQLAAIVESSSDAIIGKTLDGIITSWNKGAEKIYGYRTDEIIGKPISTLVPPSLHAEADGLLEKGRKGEEVVNHESERTRKDGKRIHVALTLSPIKDDAGNISGISTIARDITERKLGEAALHRLNRELRAISNCNQILMRVEDEQTLLNEICRIICDQADYRMAWVGYAENDDTKTVRPVAWAGFDSGYVENAKISWAEDTERGQGPAGTAIRSGKIFYGQDFANEPEMTPWRENALLRGYRSGIALPLKDESAKVFGVLLIYSTEINAFVLDEIRLLEELAGDLGFGITVLRTRTERKKAEEELRRYKDHLEEEVQLRTIDLVLARNAAEAANRAKSVFLSSMSHELRTPMNAILGFSNMMRKDPLLQDEQRQNLDIINRSGEHLLTLINDVLEMAKIEAGRVQVESTPFDLGSLVRDVTDMMHVRAQEKGLQLLIDQSSEFPRYIRGDEARVRQVLTNLLGNAVKFTRHGGVTVRFGLKPHATPPRLLIEVEDSGIGISAADQKKIFEPFVQFGETAAQQGTGLGLSITRQFVQLMGGTISFGSTLGKGSTFRVELPMERVASADVAQPESTDRGEIVGLAPGQPEYRILIVEDQLDNQLLLARLMKNVGFQAKVAENGEQAVGLFQSWQPQLIWMDRRMPVMDGLEATRRIRELTGGRAVKIVAVTASAFTEQREEMLKAGMDDFVRKPYRFNEIYECMTKQLGVQYTYAEAPEVQEVSDVVLTAEMLAVLPADLRRELHAALESLEGERITAVIGQVASFDSKLHKTLSRLADNFDYPAILKALQTNPPGTVT